MLLTEINEEYGRMRIKDSPLSRLKQIEEEPLTKESWESEDDDVDEEEIENNGNNDGDEES